MNPYTNLMNKMIMGSIIKKIETISLNLLRSLIKAKEKI